MFDFDMRVFWGLLIFMLIVSFLIGIGCNKYEIKIEKKDK